MSASPNNTVMERNIPYWSDLIVDSHGNDWTIAQDGQITINGRLDTSTANVIELAYVNGQIWQENNQGLWWEKTTTTIGNWNYKGAHDPLSGTLFNIEGPAGVSAVTNINTIVAENHTGGAVPYQYQVIPGFSSLQVEHVYLYHDSYEVAGRATSLGITGTSVIAGGAKFTADGTTVNDSPMGVRNDGTMYVEGSTISVGYLSGQGAIVASGGSVINTDGSAASETMQLRSSHLYIGGAQGTQGLPTYPSFGMSFLAPIHMDAGSSITLVNIATTSEIFAKSSPTAGELFLYNGATKVADLHISGAANIYETTWFGGKWGPETVLTESRTYNTAPYHQ